MTSLVLLAFLLGMSAQASKPLTEAQAIALAKETLNKQTGLSVSQVELQSATAVKWADTGLGCPEKGRVYTPTVTPGYRIVLRARGQTYRVHVGDNRVVLCGSPFEVAKESKLLVEESPKMEGSPMPGAEEGSEKAVQQAKEDLAKRLSAPVDTITVVAAKAVQWPDSSLGCPKPGLLYMQMIQEGLLIRLKAAGRIYEYHTGPNQAPFLCENPSKPVPDSPGPPISPGPPRHQTK